MTETASRRPELLVPAGGPEVLRVAIAYGADAVYLGGEAFGLRAKARNFSLEELDGAIRTAHAQNVRVYLAVNILAHNDDITALQEYLQAVRDMRPDGLIIADPGVFRLAKEICPEIPRHISTQANNTNRETCRFWLEQGASRIVTARELSLREIRELREALPAEMELESFVHGAMCISYSGRCLLSNFLNGRDANRGECTHPCRWKYALMEESRPGEYFPVEEDARGTYIFNSKDLCMIEHIPELIEAGIDSFKVEGRMKTALYVATITRAYRKAIDLALRDPDEYRVQIPWLRDEVSHGTNRHFTTGFYFGKPTEEDQIYETNTYHTDSVYLGTVEDVAQDTVVLHQKNKFSVNDTIEILLPDGSTPQAQVAAICNAEGEAMESAPHAGQELHVTLSFADGRTPAIVPDLVLRKPV